MTRQNISARVIHGDCTTVLRDLAREGVLVDAVCSDPPYHLASIVARLGSPDAAPIQSGATGAYKRASQGFMGQQWDGGDVAFRVDTWRRVFDVMKPGAHLLAFAATKGYHRMVCAIEDAGFEIRDMVPWLYGTGFPKSHNLDGEWEGWGTALKPAIEPIVLAQRPISESSIVANVLHDGSDEVLDAFAAYGERGALAPVHTRGADKFRNTYGAFKGNDDEDASTFRGDNGTAARFFYSSKATQGERIFECRECGAHTVGKPDCGHMDMRTHPTVKPISLMRYLVELIAPPGGLVLDPFAGTGTTAAAAREAGMQSLSIEADENHVRDIGVRLGIPVDDLISATVKARAVDHGDQRDMFA